MRKRQAERSPRRRGRASPGLDWIRTTPERLWQAITDPVGDSCRLTVTHDQLRADANAELYGGWPMILSGLKTLLETGEMLTTTASQMYLKPSAA